MQYIMYCVWIQCMFQLSANDATIYYTYCDQFSQTSALY